MNNSNNAAAAGQPWWLAYTTINSQGGEGVEKRMREGDGATGEGAPAKQAKSDDAQAVGDGEKSEGFLCMICNTKCATRNLLTSHLMTVHEGAGAIIDAPNMSNGILAVAVPSKDLKKAGGPPPPPPADVTSMPASIANTGSATSGASTTKPSDPEESPLPAASPVAAVKFSTSPGGKPSKKFQCKVCHWVCLSAMELEIHLRTLHVGLPSAAPPGQKPTCPRCGALFEQEFQLENHIKTVHEGATALPCGQCGEVFVTKEDLRDHVETAHEETYQCRKCGKLFPTKNELRKHIKKMHQGQYECVVCRQRFSSKQYMERHTKAVHEDAFRCVHCDQKFSSQQYVEKHIRAVHEGIRRFECHYCGKKMAEKGDLKRHIMAVHEGIKNYQCVQCGKRFAEMGNLRQHIKAVHEGAYHCSICDKYFSSQRYVKHHIKTVHEKDKVLQQQKEEQLLERDKLRNQREQERSEKIAAIREERQKLMPLQQVETQVGAMTKTPLQQQSSSFSSSPAAETPGVLPNMPKQELRSPSQVKDGQPQVINAEEPQEKPPVPL